MLKDKKHIENCIKAVSDVIISSGIRQSLSACMIKEISGLNINDVWIGLSFLVGFKGLKIKYESMIMPDSYHFYFDKDKINKYNPGQYHDICENILDALHSERPDYIWTLGELSKRSKLKPEEIFSGLGIISYAGKARTKLADEEMLTFLKPAGWPNKLKNISSFIKICKEII